MISSWIIRWYSIGVRYYAIHDFFMSFVSSLLYLIISLFQSFQVSKFPRLWDSKCSKLQSLKIPTFRSFDTAKFQSFKLSAESNWRNCWSTHVPYFGNVFSSLPKHIIWKWSGHFLCLWRPCASDEGANVQQIVKLLSPKIMWITILKYRKG